MSIEIETLQRTFQPTNLPRTKKGSSDGTAAFATVFAALGKGEGASAAAQRDVVQELMRVELMQSSLSIGDAGAPHSYQSPALASLLKGLAAYKDAARAAEGGAAAAVQPHVAPQLEHAGAGTGAISRTASDFLGTPYRFGGEGPSGIDCSSFVQQVFREHQINLPRTAREQINVGKDVAREDLKEGDLVFFRTYASYPSHVGIYLGHGKMIHASSKAGEVTVSDMDTQYFQARYLGAKRVT